jgi:hypothetical protein
MLYLYCYVKLIKENHVGRVGLGNALLHLTSILSYNPYFISGAMRPRRILNYISKISVRYNNACI